jgi:hypothetical protein
MLMQREGNIAAIKTLSDAQIIVSKTTVLLKGRLGGRGSILNRNKKFFSSPDLPYGLWAQQYLLFNVYGALCPRVKDAGM